MAGAADRPRITVAITGAGLPGHARAATDVEGSDAVARARVRLQHFAHDPAGARRGQAALDHRLVIGVTHAAGDAVAVERSERADQILQARAGAAQDQRQVGRAAGRETQLDAGVRQARGKARRADPLQQVHRRHVQRQPQRAGSADRPVERHVEIAGAVAAEALRRIDQQAFRMDQAIVQRHRVQERLERGAWRTPGLHHVHVAQPLAVAERQGADIGARLQGLVVDHQQRSRRALRQRREIAGHAFFQRTLQADVDAALDACLARMRRVQALRQQRGVQGRA